MVKGKRWKKGQSSSSNPTSKKYRELAKNNRSFFTFGLPSESSNGQKSQLTAKALAELDAGSSAHVAFPGDDAKSMISDADSADTFRSWASNWSDCTNATFNRVHRYWKSNSALHKEILAVLAAVTEVIKENDGKETETEYFAALMTGLESVKDKEDSAAAFVYLIALAIKKVPETVLRAKFQDLLASFSGLIAKYGEKATNVTLIKSCLMCLCWLLKSQDQNTWKSETTRQVFFTIMKFIVHSKPKIRKCGQEAVRLIMNSCVSSTTNTELSTLTADYCIKLIVDEGVSSGAAIASKAKDEKAVTSSEKILYTLTLLKHIVHHFIPTSLKDVGECLLQLITLKDILITSASFQVLHSLFEAQANHLTADLNGQMVNALYDYQPSENDPQQLIAWLAVLESALRCLNRINRQNCLPHLPHFFQVTMLTLSNSYHQSVHLMATNCLRSVLEQCVQTNVDLLTAELQQATDPKKSILHKVFAHIEAGTSYQYHAAWPCVMKILACAFTCFKNKDTFVIVEKALSSLANLRESEQFTFKKEADEAIGRAIQTYGPRLMLDCIPLNITGDESTFDYPRSWMLPLLQTYTEKTELAFFARTLMPLAKKLRLKSESFAKIKRPLEAKIFDTLQNQIWSLLPSFCDFATDFAETFPAIAKLLGEVLEKQADLRAHVLQALRTAILRTTDENRVVMKRFAKNYLPVMFNIYTTEVKVNKDPSRQSILDTIKCYLKITEPDLRNTYLKQALVNYDKYAQLDEKSAQDAADQPKVVFDFNKMTKDKEAKPVTTSLYKFARYSFLDLMCVLVAYGNEETVSLVYELTTSAISSKSLDKTVQKKCYKILDVVLTSGKVLEVTKADEFDIHKLGNNQAIAGFVHKKFATIADTLVKTLGQCNAAAKVPRLRCILNLLSYVQSAEQKSFVRQTLPEVILCIKEVNQKSRDASLNLLTEMAKLWQRLSGGSEIDSLNEFFHLLMIGLAGSKNMVSCTCLALSALAYEFKEHVSGPMISELVETACLLVKSESENREVLMSSLSLLKVLTSIFTQSTLGQYLKAICGAVVSLHEKRPSGAAAPVSKSQRVRTMIKLLLKKLMKKFSFELVYENVFDEHKDEAEKAKLTSIVRQGLENLLTNLKKLLEKEKQRKLEEQTAAKKGAGKDKPVDLVSMYTSKTSGNPANEIEELLKESSSEDEDEAKNDRASQRTAKGAKNGKKPPRDKKKSSSMDAWLQENENDDPLDLLDPMAMKRVLATKPLTKEQIEKKKAKQAEKNRGFKMSADGRLMIEDDSDDDDHHHRHNDRKSLKSKKGPDDIDEMMDTLSLSKKSMKSSKSKQTNKKRQMDSDDDEDSDDEMDKKSNRPAYKAGGTGIHRPQAKKTVEFGSEYRAKKAAGDVKIKNKPDPYAYIPFNYGKLNKRKKAKLEGEFRGVVKAVKRAGANVTKGRPSNRK